jgi:hypothetical protein
MTDKPLMARNILGQALSTGYEPDEFREMMTEMAWNLATP